jgi:hypothetical protein
MCEGPWDEGLADEGTMCEGLRRKVREGKKG